MGMMQQMQMHLGGGGGNLHGGIPGLTIDGATVRQTPTFGHR